jgi:sulfur carrier protein
MTINGIAVSGYDGLSVSALLLQRGLPMRGVAIAVNGIIVPRSQWEHARVVTGDAIEVVTAAAGG